jgi:beta-mannanase
MKKPLIILLIMILTLNVAFSQNIVIQTEAKIPAKSLCTPNPSKEAVALYKYLNDMKGKKILSGQQDSPWGIDEFEYLKTNTGKQPAIKGMDFISQGDNDNEVQKAIDWWKAGGIPTIMWHWGAPSIGEGYEASKKPIEIDNCFVEGTAENKAFWTELKTKGDLLQKLRDANVPVIWRPFHELNGNWFWWGKQGPERFKKLWITMFNYYVKDRGLNNLIWTLCYTGQPDGDWYPGDQYVDIAGADTYVKIDSPQSTMFNKVKTIINDRTPIAFHECGIPPNPDKCLSEGIMWSWWMEWHTSHLQQLDKTYLKYVYDHELVITLDEVPDIMAKYGVKTK